MIAVVGFRWPYGTGLLTAILAGMAAGIARGRGAGRGRRRTRWTRHEALADHHRSAGIGTYGIRLSVLVFVHHSALPRTAREALRFVTPAVLAAIILPAVVYAGGSGDFDASGRATSALLAALVAAAVAWATKSVWATIGGGDGGAVGAAVGGLGDEWTRERRWAARRLLHCLHSGDTLVSRIEL